MTSNYARWQNMSVREIHDELAIRPAETNPFGISIHQAHPGEDEQYRVILWFESVVEACEYLAAAEFPVRFGADSDETEQACNALEEALEEADECEDDAIGFMRTHVLGELSLISKGTMEIEWCGRPEELAQGDDYFPRKVREVFWEATRGRKKCFDDIPESLLGNFFGVISVIDDYMTEENHEWNEADDEE